MLCSIPPGLALEASASDGLQAIMCVAGKRLPHREGKQDRYLQCGAYLNALRQTSSQEKTVDTTVSVAVGLRLSLRVRIPSLAFAGRALLCFVICIYG
jgi:hypothetical protein